MKGFIVYSTYRVIKGDSYVFLFGRLENKENFVTINKYQPYFFIKESDLKKARKLSPEFEAETTKLKDPEENKVVKILSKTPNELTKLRKELEDHSIPCYEADIRYPQRFLIDQGIQGSMNIEGDYDSEGNIDRIYKQPKLTPSVYLPKLKTLALDIETDSNAKEIYCISIYTDNFKKVLINSKKKLNNAIACNSEIDVLEKFVEVIQEQDPDIITGWNLIDFDLKIIFEKLKDYNIPIALGRDNTPCRLRIESSFFRESKADIPGRQVLDGIHILKSSFIKLKDYKLDTAAKHFVKEAKLIQEEGDKGEIITSYFKHQQQKLVDYNLKDSELVIKILENSKTLDLTIKRSLITGMPLNRVAASIGSLDSLYLKRARKAGYVFPCSKFATEVDKGVGGFVMESKPGIYNNIIVFDFKSLYPSVIRTFNIDPITLTEKGLSSPAEFNFKKEEGILPKIIQELWEERDLFRKNKDETGRYAIKILMNSFYGAMASPMSRYFSRALGNSITMNAQAIIKHTAELMKEKGLEVIYGDTDSLFVISKTKTEEEANKLGKKLEKEINEYYKVWIEKTFQRKSFLELEYEKTYTKFLMPKLRHSVKGAKKRYAGLRAGKVEVVGLEAVRGDWTDLAREYQRELLDRVFKDKDITTYTKKLIQDIKEGKYDKKLVYRKSIRKDVEEYTKISPPHVKAARKLKKIESTKIEYVLTEDGPEPIQNQTHKIDYQHYIDKQIKPIAESILALYNKTFEEVEKGHKQSSLFDY